MSISAANGVRAPDVRAPVVLVVEDEFLVRYDVADYLRDAGYAVVEAGSGEEAIALCESAMSIDIVFTDINLPGPVSGWEVAERCRADRPGVPVIYASGQFIDPERRVPGSVFVSKPYKNTDIVKAFGRLQSK